MKDTSSAHDKVRVEMMLADPKYKDGIPIEWTSALRRDNVYAPGFLVKIEEGYGIVSHNGDAGGWRIYLGEVNLAGSNVFLSDAMQTTASLFWRFKDNELPTNSAAEMGSDT